MTHPQPPSDGIDEPETPTHVVERDELLALTKRTGTSLGTSPTSAADYERFSKLVCLRDAHQHILLHAHQQLSKYQEQPTLLDPLLDTLLQPLATALQTITRTHMHTSTDVHSLQAVCQMVWRLCNTRYGMLWAERVLAEANAVVCVRRCLSGVC